MNACLVSVRNDERDLKEMVGMDTNDANICYLMGGIRHLWCGERNLDKFKEYDLIMFTMSKVQGSYENTWLELVKLLKKKYPNTIIVVYQEAEMEWSMYRPINEQINLFENLKYADMFICHNQSDIGYFKYLIPNIKVSYCPSALPIAKIKEYAIPVEKKRTDVLEIIFGSSFDHRSCGMFGYAVAMELKRKYKGRIKLTQYHRTQWNDDRNEQIKKHFGYDFEILPHMGWLDYITRLSKSYISMNLMMLAAAGRDAIVFAALGIPHIGNARLELLSHRTNKLFNILDLQEVCMYCDKLLVNDCVYYVHQQMELSHVMVHSFGNVKRHLQCIFENELGVRI